MNRIPEEECAETGHVLKYLRCRCACGQARCACGKVTGYDAKFDRLTPKQREEANRARREAWGDVAKHMRENVESTKDAKKGGVE